MSALWLRPDKRRCDCGSTQRCVASTLPHLLSLIYCVPSDRKLGQGRAAVFGRPRQPRRKARIVIYGKIDVEDRHGIDQVANASDARFRVEQGPGGTLAVACAMLQLRICGKCYHKGRQLGTDNIGDLIKEGRQVIEDGS